MYEQFFGLTEKPFSLTPNPRFVFQSEQYRVAEDALVYGIGQKEGFMLVTGAPGTGKTTLCRDLLEKLDPEKYRVALLFNPFLNGVEMLQALLSEFGLGDASTSSRKELLDRLNTYLLQQLANGRTCIAIFDEAQHLSTEFLEQIRVLSNLETATEKLIQIILVGQPELLALIRTPQMAQLDQRVSVRCTLTHLSLDETAHYLSHRLNVAGAHGRVRFQAKAIRVLHAATRGVPRLINLTADRSLLAGYTAQARSIGDEHVRQALESLSGEEGIDAKASSTPTLLSNPMSARGWSRVGIAAASLAVVIAGLWFAFDGTAEVLALRAARSTSAAAAEHDYEQIARAHTGSRQRENALLRLAQFQLARGAHQAALKTLETLGTEYSGGRTADERKLWTAKAQLAAGDTASACALVRALPPATRDNREAEPLSRGCDAFAARADSVRSDSSRALSAKPVSMPAPRDSAR
ncbi:MAG TPA: AAA family ATPase [Gemmatimonadaceae bacterium]